MTDDYRPNGCTFLPTQPKQVEMCCIAHDTDYRNKIGKIRADYLFFQCLWKKKFYIRAILFPLATLIIGCYFYYRKR